ncbi:MAG: DUF5110 domain-containing protein, partial [Halochromatium sp.]
CLTLGPARQSTREPLTELTLDAYPDDEQDGSWTLIEDAGDGWSYPDGKVAETTLEIASGRQRPTLTIGPRQGGWRPPPRQLVLRLHLARRPAHVLLDGILRADWWWDQAGQAAVVSLMDDGEAHRLISYRSGRG